MGKNIFFWKTEDGIAELENIFASMGEDVVVQEYIKQHKQMALMNPSSVQTIRIVTLLHKGTIRVVCGVFQVGTDPNARMSQLCLGGIQAVINENGKLDKYAYDTEFNKYAEHPCGIKFDGFKVPGYKLVCEKAIELHQKMGNFNIVSWDFAVGVNEQPIFIEMNLVHGGIMTYQVARGPIFGDLTDEILDEVYKK